MENEQIKVKIANQNKAPLINPKFYPLVWVALILCAFVRSFYQLYTTYIQIDNIALALYYALGDLVLGGGVSSLFVVVASHFLYAMGAKRGMRAIPKNDFTYLVMIFVAVAWFVSGVINLFSFIEPALMYCNVFTGDIVAMTVSMALMFFLVFVPKYLNPKQAERCFNFYGKIYVIFNSVVYIMGAMGILLCIIIAEDPELLAQMGHVYYSVNGVDIPIAELFEMYAFARLGMKISAYIAIAVSVIMIVAYFVLSNMLKNKAKDFKEEVKPENMDGIFFTDGKNFYTVDDVRNGNFGGNPFGGTPQNGNPFDDDNDDKNDKVFDEFDI